MEYVVKISSTGCKNERNGYGFYHGKCYMVNGEYYPRCGGRQCVDELTKRYTSEKRAKRSAERVVEKCGYVKGYEIYKLTDEGMQLVYNTLTEI